jgi:hypothetical protein
MAFLDQEFNVADMPVSTSSFDPLPEGWYNVTIAGAELKSTKAGNGQYIAVKYQVTGPTMQGRVVFGNLNIKNPNQKAEEIGREQLGQIMRATGLAKVTDTDMLIGGQLAIKLSIRRDEQYGDSNDVKGFKALAGSVPAAMPSTPFNAAPAPAAAPAKAAPPWAKK